MLYTIVQSGQSDERDIVAERADEVGDGPSGTHIDEDVHAEAPAATG